MMLFTLVPLFYLIPVVTAIITKKHLPLITSIAFIAAAFSSIVYAKIFGFNSALFEYPWFTAGDHVFSIQLISDKTSVLLLVFSTIIAFSVSVFSQYYFKNEKAAVRYFLTLSFFMFFMTILILSADLLLSFFCWELIGLCSYLLIGYYRSEPISGAAATKALIYNKIGDIGFIVGLMALWAGTGTFNILELENLSDGLDSNLQTLVSIGLIMAIAAKSAQFPLHNWLPDAMAGPSPVSALIHSATMVAAGIFLIVRVHFLFTPTALLIAGGMGMITALLGSWNAIFQNKIKQVLAWSTISQLGLMLMAAGWGNPNGSLMHLMSHGFFKAGLFMSAGYLLKSISSGTENELEAIARSESKDKLIAIVTLIFALSLTGFPLTASFLSKEALASGLSAYALIPFYVINGLTVLYTLRLLWILSPYLKESTFKGISGFSGPLVILSFFTGWWVWSFNPLHNTDHFSLTGAASLTITLLGITVLIVSVMIAVWMLRNGSLGVKPFYLQMDSFYQKTITNPFFKLSEISGKIDPYVIDRLLHFLAYFQISFAHLTAAFDRYIVDGSAKSIGWLVGSTGNLIRKISNGNVQSYLWWTLTAILILVIWQS